METTEERSRRLTRARAEYNDLRMATRDNKAVEEQLTERLMTMPETGCMVYCGPLAPNGYGIFAGSKYSLIGRQQYAHRAAYLIWKGPIPKGFHLDHLCRNKACCNPEHLEAVTCRENLLRGPTTIASTNAAKTHCKLGHELSGHNLLIRGINSKKRVPARECRTCCNARERARWAKKKGVDKKKHDGDLQV